MLDRRRSSLGHRVASVTIAGIVAGSLVAAPFSGCPRHGLEALSEGIEGPAAGHASHHGSVGHAGPTDGVPSPKGDHGPCDCVGRCQTQSGELAPPALVASVLEELAPPTFRPVAAPTAIPPRQPAPYEIPFPNPPPLAA